MPRAPKACGRHGCETRTVGKTYCPEHQPVGWDNASKGRSSTGDKAFRRDVLRRDKGVCQIRGPRCKVRATEADHIVPIAEGGTRHDLANGQAACDRCHAAKTQAEAARGRARAAQRAG